MRNLACSFCMRCMRNLTCSFFIKKLKKLYQKAVDKIRENDTCCSSFAYKIVFRKRAYFAKCMKLGNCETLDLKF